MKVLYMAPRYHTNQVPVVRGWLRNGHQVMFLSQFAGEVEEYGDIRPVILGYSRFSNVCMWIQNWLFHGGKQTVKEEFDIRIKWGIPPMLRLYRLISCFRPDIVIMRERSVYNIPVYFICRWKNICSILYNQSPLWDSPDRDSGILHRFLIKMLPTFRMTPVLGNKGKDNVRTKNSFFVPFVQETGFAPEQREYFKDDMIHLLCVARYEERKRLFMLIDAVQGLLLEGMAELVIAGEAADEEQRAYYKKLQGYVRKKGLDEKVYLLKNLDREQVFVKYKEADLFILPSTRERASIAQLEAMSCSLAVICSDTNGSACYVRNGENGYLFHDDSMESLKEKAEALAGDRKKLAAMGRRSYEIIKENCQFENYYEKLMKIVDEEKNGSRKQRKK